MLVTPDGELQPKPPGHLVVEMAGVVCVPYSNASNHEGSAHASEVTLSTHLVERKVMAERMIEDVFFVESANNFPFESKVGEVCGETHLLLSIKGGPEHCGWPAKRARLQGAGLNRKTTVWTGPKTQKDIPIDFDARFHKATMTSGKVFFAADPDTRMAEYLKVVWERGFDITLDQLQAMPNNEVLQMVLTPCA